MTSLFRPWTEDRVGKSGIQELATFYPDSSETELWAPEKKNEENEGLENTDDREIKYKNVKEHMKKRSEKYWLKKLKLSEEKKADVMRDSYSTWECSKISEIGCGTYLTPSYSPPFERFSNSVEFFPNKNSGLCLTPNYTYPHGAELLETALAQGFPPNLFEEYARFLTEQQKQVADRSRKQRPKKFRCPHCQVGFSNNGQLKGHIRIHTGERPFKCDAESCGKSFTRNEELTRHRRIHSGLRPFPCTECGKRFGRKDHLKKHVKTHFQQRYQLVPILPSQCPYFYGL